MTENDYRLAEYNLIEAQTINTSERLNDTLKLVLIFITESRSILFKDGKMIKLSLFNIVSFVKFVKLSYQFIRDIIEKWK